MNNNIKEFILISLLKYSFETIKRNFSRVMTLLLAVCPP